MLLLKLPMGVEKLAWGRSNSNSKLIAVMIEYALWRNVYEVIGEGVELNIY